MVILVSNICHLVNKFHNLYVNVANHLADIIFLTETWLNANIPDSAVNLQGYQCVHKDKSSGEGGGVATHVINTCSLGP